MGIQKGNILDKMLAGKGKATRGKDSTKTKTTLSAKCGLTLSTARVRSLLLKHRVAERVSPKAYVFLTGALEYLIGELLEVASIKAKEAKKQTLTNRHIYMGAKSDKEMFQLILGNTCYIKDAGFVTENPVPSSKKAKKEAAKTAKSSAM